MNIIIKFAYSTVLGLSLPEHLSLILDTNFLVVEKYAETSKTGKTHAS